MSRLEGGPQAETGLARAPRPRERQETDRSGVEQRQDPVELAFPPDELGDRRGQVAPDAQLLRFDVERRVVAENCALELLESVARVDPEIFGEHQARPLVGVQGLGLAAGSVERKHEMAMQPFPVAVFGNERSQLGHEVRVAAKSQVGFDPVFEGGKTELLQACSLGLREGLGGEVSSAGPRHSASASPRVVAAATLSPAAS